MNVVPRATPDNSIVPAIPDIRVSTADIAQLDKRPKNKGTKRINRVLLSFFTDSAFNIVFIVKKATVFKQWL